MKPVATVEIKSPTEIGMMRESGAIVAAALRVVSEAVVPGVSTAELDRIAEAEILRRKAKPAFLNYRGYPATLCVSLNDEVVHGIPRRDRIVAAGDIVSLDLGCVLRGYFADAAVTVPAGKTSREALELIAATRQALAAAVEQMRPERRLGDIGHAIQEAVEPKGFSVVRAFVGHGIGRALHEDPPVPNVGRAGTGLRLVPGMVLALEPMINQGVPEIRVLGDGWTAVTADGKLSAHFEHSVTVTSDGPEILTIAE